jgi:hypothetical protein
VVSSPLPETSLLARSSNKAERERYFAFGESEQASPHFLSVITSGDDARREAGLNDLHFKLQFAGDAPGSGSARTIPFMVRRVRFKI